jgi:Cyclin, N-terminal domain
MPSLSVSRRKTEYSRLKEMAVTALFLASKVEETMRTVKQVALALLGHRDDQDYAFEAPQSLEEVSLFIDSLWHVRKRLIART